MGSVIVDFMETMTQAVVALVGILHIGFMSIEMFLWTTPRGLKIFKQSQAQANDSKALAFNQGLYNGFLACGIFWGLVHPDPGFAKQIQMFFLLCVIVAGVVGGLTVSRRIFILQSGPALVGLGLLLCA